MTTPSDWIKKRTDEVIRDLIKPISSKQFPKAALIKVLNQERTKGQLPDGRIVDIEVSGRPQNIAMGVRISENTYLLQDDFKKARRNDAVNNQAYALRHSSVAVASTLYDLKSGLSVSVPIPVVLMTHATTALDNWALGFTPSGKHLIFTIIENIVDSTLKTTTGLRAHWVYWKNFSITSVNEIPTFSYTELVQDSAIISSSLIPPSNPSITWTGSSSFNVYGGSFGESVTVTLEDDPNFPENSEIAYTIDTFPESDNSYDSGNIGHNIISVFYEEKDINGNLQPAVDFVGCVTLYKRVTKVKRVRTVTSSASDTHVQTATTEYNTYSGRDYYMDVSRVTTAAETLLSSDPYAAGFIGDPLDNVSPGTLIGKWTTNPPSPNSYNSGIWGTGGQVVQTGPDCIIDQHQHTYMDDVDLDTYPTDNQFLEDLGASVSTITPVNIASLTFEYIQFSSSVPGLCNTDSHTREGVGADQIRYKQTTNNTDNMFYYSANTGLSGVTNLGSSSGKSISTGFKSTTGDGITNLGVAFQAALIDLGGHKVVQGGYLTSGGTDVESIFTNGFLAYTDRVILDLLTFPVMNNEVYLNVIDSTPDYSAILLTIEETVIDGVDKWKIKKWRYGGATFTLLKTVTVDRPSAFTFSSPNSFILKG